MEAQTSRKHLEEKVEDLAKQLKGNEEKLAVYERRPGATGPAQPVDQDASREQQLETEVAELRYYLSNIFLSVLSLTLFPFSQSARLKVTEVDLAAARSHRDQYQEISQASEAALASLNSTFDEYKASSEAQIARQEVVHLSASFVLLWLTLFSLKSKPYKNDWTRLPKNSVRLGLSSAIPRNRLKQSELRGSMTRKSWKTLSSI